MKMFIFFVLAIVAFLGGAVGGDLVHRNRTDTAATTSENHTPETPADEDATATHETAAVHEASHSAEADASQDVEADWFRFPNQFFVPIIRNGTTVAVMVMTLTLETSTEALPQIEAQEHRLRDALLGALMIKANTGAFDGNFTSEAAMAGLREALLKATQMPSDAKVTKVLIGDIARQEQ
ncbi:hypothetical protein [Paracoccus aestuariivivens]|uniref:Flagellar basal body-associated protein FliL n=1 Tax=Paracoccus aestuariivivens TaxID=1820333 RepID=A0A6L6JDV3_9RHOB|nr:hypothetical protein [Paracoccus aestuariivivens]MTH78909.1 hypothetical protein [Paracoccus aestuariivivens]